MMMPGMLWRMCFLIVLQAVVGTLETLLVCFEEWLNQDEYWDLAYQQISGNVKG
jgi:hypothetical protein